MSDAGHDQVGCGVCGNPEGHDGVCPIGRELFELRQALEASRAETREALEWVDRLTKWGDGAAALIISELDIDGEEEMNTRGILSQARAFRAGCGGGPAVVPPPVPGVPPEKEPTR